MDELLRQALDRRNQLRAELEALDKFIRSYSEVHERRKPVVEHVDLFTRLPKQSNRVRRADENAAAMDAAEKFILEAGKPLSRTELLERLERTGHKIEGGDKSKVLGTNLWRAKRFYNLKGAGYWPISTPIPENYQHLQPRESQLIDTLRK